MSDPFPSNPESTRDLLPPRNRFVDLLSLLRLIYLALLPLAGCAAIQASGFVIGRGWGFGIAMGLFIYHYLLWALYETEELSWKEQNEDILATIAATLPSCPCGGRFTPGADPKCPSCGTPFAHKNNPIMRLTDPSVILLEGACFFGRGEPYRVRIIDR